MGKNKPNVGELPALVLLRELYPLSRFEWQGDGDSGASPDILRYGPNCKSGVTEGIEVVSAEGIYRGALGNIEAHTDDLKRGEKLLKALVTGRKDVIHRGIKTFYPNLCRVKLDLVLDAMYGEEGISTDRAKTYIETVGMAQKAVELVKSKVTKWGQGHYKDSKSRAVAVVFTENLDDLVHPSMRKGYPSDTGLWRVYIIAPEIEDKAMGQTVHRLISLKRREYSLLELVRCAV